jgi:hypothetical protein
MNELEQKQMEIVKHLNGAGKIDSESLKILFEGFNRYKHYAGSGYDHPIKRLDLNAVNRIARHFEESITGVETQIADICVATDCDYYMGDYGTGRSVVTPSAFEESEKEGPAETWQNWNGNSLGDWMSSSASC